MLSLSRSRRRSFQGTWPHSWAYGASLGVMGSPQGAASSRRLTDHLKCASVMISGLDSGSLATVVTQCTCVVHRVSTVPLRGLNSGCA